MYGGRAGLVYEVGISVLLLIYYVVALYIMYSNQKSYLDFHDWIEHWTSYI